MTEKFIEFEVAGWANFRVSVSSGWECGQNVGHLIEAQALDDKGTWGGGVIDGADIKRLVALFTAPNHDGHEHD